MRENEIRVRTHDGLMTTFIAHPDGPGPYPVAVLYMDSFGYREQIKDNARRFAGEGYYCMAPDLFYRSRSRTRFDPPRLGREENRQELLRVIASISPEAVMRDTYAMFATTNSDPTRASGAKVCVGYCVGARLALHAAATMSGHFVAAAAIYPRALITGEPDLADLNLGSVQGELYIAFAAHDQSATAETVDHITRELQSQHVAGTVERLSGTHAGFAMADLPAYNHAAAERHFDRTLDLWRRNISGRTWP
jgi:carboxymethylenebutenolidase